MDGATILPGGPECLGAFTGCDIHDPNVGMDAVHHPHPDLARLARDRCDGIDVAVIVRQQLPPLAGGRRHQPDRVDWIGGEAVVPHGDLLAVRVIDKDQIAGQALDRRKTA